MIDLQVEKEIRTKNKIFKGLTVRQLASLVIGLVFVGMVLLITGIPFNQFYYIMPFGIIIGYGIGWYTKSGLTIEQIIYKWVLQYIYKNKHRKYRTLNQYILMYNEYYNKLRAKDNQNKKIRKIKKKEEKMLAKKIKKSKIKGYV